MPNRPPILTPRLLAVASQICQCRCFADIGTDHAYLPVYMCMNGRCDFSIASDIGKGPLERAEKTVLQYGMSDKIQLRLGGGLDTLEYAEADVISIAGMGGIEISNILQSGQNKLTPSTLIILQPMTSVPELREFLWENRWNIKCELLAREDEKIYNILTITPPSEEHTGYTTTKADLYLGYHLIKSRPEHFEEYLNKKIKKLRNMIDGLKISQTDSSQKKLEYCESLLKELEII